jgi:hypothetical protein
MSITHYLFLPTWCATYGKETSIAPRIGGKTFREAKIDELQVTLIIHLHMQIGILIGASKIQTEDAERTI